VTFIFDSFVSEFLHPMLCSALQKMIVFLLLRQLKEEKNEIDGNFNLENLERRKKQGLSIFFVNMLAV